LYLESAAAYPASMQQEERNDKKSAEWQSLSAAQGWFIMVSILLFALQSAKYH
jgi:hypothetical protein